MTDQPIVMFDDEAAAAYRTNLSGRVSRDDLFYATPDGFYCPNCGEWQHGF